MKQVTVFEAEDGTKFDSSEACEAYEETLKYQRVIDDFMAHPLCTYKGGPQAKIVRNTILAWEQFKLLPAEEPAEPPKKRGRPKKVVEEVMEEAPAKKRGRPRKQAEATE